MDFKENTPRMKAFFEREISRYNKRKKHLNDRYVKVEELAQRVAELQQENEKIKDDYTTICKIKNEYDEIIKKQMKMIKFMGDRCKKHGVPLN